MLDKLKDKADAQVAAKRQEMKARAGVFHRAFVQNSDGKKVLDEWVLRYSMTPIQDDDASAFQCGVAEGRRQVVKEILDQIGFAEREV